MDDAYLESILAECGQERYPEGFRREYEALECLAHRENCLTLLVRHRETGLRYVAKCCEDKTLFSRLSEADLLKKLDHPGLPRFAGAYENEHMLCTVREYVPGVPLDRYAMENALGEAQAVRFAAAICDILAYLHGRAEPVVHRDIKPQNLVVEPGGSLRLIDFGISRVYDEGAAEDTVCFGTRRFAAPEQYGFAQTDARSDIFSLGILLGWMLTGETELARVLPKIRSHSLGRVVRKCAAFAPDMRYRSAARAKRALLRAHGRLPARLAGIGCAVLACAACLCLGFALGRYTQILPASAAPASAAFEEPLVEQAVRLALHLEADAPIDEKDLLSVTELYICGDRAAASDAEFGTLIEHVAQNDGVLKNGGLTSLSDFAMLKNLKVLRVAMEDVEDLSPLSSLAALEVLDLRQNPIEDVSPLAALLSLRELCLYDTRVSDLTPLAACALLGTLDAGKTRVVSMEAFAGLARIRNLSMMDAPLESLSGIETLIRLERLGLSSVSDGDLRPLLSLPWLEEARLGDALRGAAEADLGDAGFRIVFP